MTKFTVGSKVFDLDLLTVPEVLNLQKEASTKQRVEIEGYLNERRDALFDRHLSSDLTIFYRLAATILTKQYPQMDQYAREVLGGGYALFRLAEKLNIALLTKQLPLELTDGVHRKMEVVCNYLDLATIFLLDTLGGTLEIKLSRQGQRLPERPNNPWAEKEYRRRIQGMKKPVLREVEYPPKQPVRPKQNEGNSYLGKKSVARNKAPAKRKKPTVRKAVASRKREPKPPKIGKREQKRLEIAKLNDKYDLINNDFKLRLFLQRSLLFLVSTPARHLICSIVTSEVWSLGAKFGFGKSVQELTKDFPSFLKRPAALPEENVYEHLQLLLYVCLVVAGDQLHQIMGEVGYVPELPDDENVIRLFAENTKRAGYEEAIGLAYQKPDCSELEEYFDPLKVLTPRQKWVLGRLYFHCKKENPNKGQLHTKHCRQEGISPEEVAEVANLVGIFYYDKAKYYKFGAELFRNPQLAEFAKLPKP